jgi:hypothetical protein
MQPGDFALTPHDVVVVPSWMPYTLHASQDLVVFSYSDRVCLTLRHGARAAAWRDSFTKLQGLPQKTVAYAHKIWDDFPHADG